VKVFECSVEVPDDPVTEVFSEVSFEGSLYGVTLTCTILETYLSLLLAYDDVTLISNLAGAPTEAPKFNKMVFKSRPVNVLLRLFV
jgi:hypothetical protein